MLYIGFVEYHFRKNSRGNYVNKKYTVFLLGAVKKAIDSF